MKTKKNKIQEASNLCLVTQPHLAALAKGLLVLFFFSTLLIFLEQNVSAHPINMKVIAEIESSNNPHAKSKNGCIGLYQISPITLKHFWQFPENRKIWHESTNPNWWGTIPTKESLFDPSFNKVVADWYFNWLSQRCDSVKEILIAYNWGIGNLRKYQQGKIKLPKETQAYLKKYEELTGGAL